MNMLCCGPWVTSVHSITDTFQHLDRASRSRLSGPPSWSEWSCPSMTSQRSIWSCLVIWGTPCTHTSCKFVESHAHLVPATVLFVTLEKDLDLNVEVNEIVQLLASANSTVRRKNKLFSGWLSCSFWRPQVQFCVRPCRSFDLQPRGRRPHSHDEPERSGSVPGHSGLLATGQRKWQCVFISSAFSFHINVFQPFTVAQGLSDLKKILPSLLQLLLYSRRAMIPALPHSAHKFKLVLPPNCHLCCF